MGHLGGNYFQNGVNYLKDIQTLTEENVSPLIRQAVYNFSQGQIANSQLDLSLKSLPRLEKFFDFYLKRNVEKICQNKKISQVLLTKNERGLGLETWDQILETMPLLTEVVHSLPFREECSLHLDHEQVIFSGQLFLHDEIENQRLRIYALTRKLLEKGAMLTFESTMSESNELVLRLKMTFVSRPADICLVNFENKAMPLVGYSSHFSRFHASGEEVYKKGRHLCIEITSELKVEKHYRPTKRFLQQKESGEILHFAFLFRPVSLIIPKKPTLVHAGEFQELVGDTGSDITKSRQDVDGRPRNYFFLDILSLMTC